MTKKEVQCSACKGECTVGTDDMGTPVTCDNCGGLGKITVIIRRDPVLHRDIVQKA